MSTSNDIVKAESLFRKGLLAFLSNKNDRNALTTMHDALAQFPDRLNAEVALVDAVQEGVFNHELYAKRSLALIEKQLRHIVAHGKENPEYSDAIKLANSVANTLNATDSTLLEAFEEAVFQWGNFWNANVDSQKENSIDTILVTSNADELMAKVCAEAPSEVRDFLDTLNTYIKANSAAPSKDFYLNLGIGIVLIREYAVARNQSMLTALNKYAEGLILGDLKYFHNLNSRNIWKRVSPEIVKQTIKSLNTAKSATTPVAAKLYTQAVIVLNGLFPNLLSKDLMEFKAISESDIDALIQKAEGIFPDVWSLSKSEALEILDTLDIQSQELDFVLEDMDQSALSTPTQTIDPMVYVFIGEAKEVLEEMRSYCEKCRYLISVQEDAEEELIEVRRCAHTLKGSGRVVGLNQLAEQAWQVERAMNRAFDERIIFSVDAIDFILKFADVFGDWIKTLEEHGTANISEEDEAFIAAGVAIIYQDKPQPKGLGESSKPDDIIIGDIKLSQALFEISNRELTHYAKQISDWINGDNVGITSEAIRFAHTLAGGAHNIGMEIIGDLSAALEVWLMDVRDTMFKGGNLDAEDIALLKNVSDVLVEQVRDFAEMRMPTKHEDLIRRLSAGVLGSNAALEEIELSPSTSSEITSIHSVVEQFNQLPVGIVDEHIDTIADDLDIDLMPSFIDEADNLNDEILPALRKWAETPSDNEVIELLSRLIHTLKGSARMVGAMQIGEMAHKLEDSLIAAERLRDRTDSITLVETGYDEILAKIAELKHVDEAKVVIAAKPSLFEAANHGHLNQIKISQSTLDMLVNNAGEIGVTRQRIEADVANAVVGLQDLKSGIEVLKKYLRDIEIYAEGQIQSRVTVDEDDFDPLEFDKFTQLQELTRFMQESIHDVQSVNNSLVESMNSSLNALSEQSSLNRDQHYELMKIRMVPVSSISERLFRTARQAAKDLSKRVNLDIVGANVSLDRSVLEKMTAPIEHLIRNSIAHGIESDRAAAGKAAIGEIKFEIKFEHNEAVFTISDDGAGLNLKAIRDKAIQKELISPDAILDEQEITALMFLSGLSTAHTLTEISGRGVGMDIVKTTVEELGGRVEVVTNAGRGTSFVCRIPTMISITHVMMFKSGKETYAIPTNIISTVLHVEAQDMAPIMDREEIEWEGQIFKLHSVAYILGSEYVHKDPGKPTDFLLIHSAGKRIALQVDALLGQQEVSVKKGNGQLAKMDGIEGVIVLNEGKVAFIINPAMFIDEDQKSTFIKTKVITRVKTKPLVMVVDDSLTVRMTTQRFLEENGYEVVLASNGHDALTKIDEANPDVMLLDIEMPKMNGFELTETLRTGEKYKNLPIVMITSRTAEKHKTRGLELGVNHYLGKPFQEDLLLDVLSSLVAVSVV